MASNEDESSTPSTTTTTTNATNGTSGVAAASNSEFVNCPQCQLEFNSPQVSQDRVCERGVIILF